ncbi:glycine betaine ABC transporter substrate-binding protein [soil metagenome]
MTPLIDFWRSHASEVMALLGQHLKLVSLSTAIATCIGVPLGIFAARNPRSGAPLVWLANVAQTIPSLAMFGFLLPLPFIGGLGARVATIVLVLYALLPIIRTTSAGLLAVDGALLEAGTALGMTSRQRLRMVELPLALPSIVAGIRVAAVIGVGTATIAAAVGAGGLGEYIFRGLSMVDSTMILAGAIPAAVIALTIDGALTLLERALRATRRRDGRTLLWITSAVAVLGIAAIVAGAFSRGKQDVVRVGSKNFTEQIILGEITAQVLERAGINVERRLNLGGTFICDRALRSGDIDLYVEYSGTAATAIFRQPVQTDPRVVFDAVRQAYAGAGLTLLEPLGFENTFAILVRGDAARRLGLKTVEDAVPHARQWRAGFGYEFLQRQDGYPGLSSAYGLQFAAPPTAMDLSLIYRALADRRVDLVAGDATSGLITALDLSMLQDSKHYFPPYDAAVVARSQALLTDPRVKTALDALSGHITIADMRAMNHAVDATGADPAGVAREFLSRLR